MEKILQAFSDIADVLPRLDRLKATFPEDTNFNQVVGLIYSDIIEFHLRAYKIFRRKAWHFWFAFDWGLFERRFKSILDKLASHCDLLDKEAAAAHFFEMKQFRDKRQLEEDAFEQQRQNQMARDVFSWLSATEDLQEEQLHRICDRRQPETCDWVLDDPEMRPWIEDDSGEGVLWMTGIPGAGKSFLCSLVVQNLQSQQHLSTLYYFCGHQSSSENTCATMLRTLAIQLLQQNLDMASLVHQAYVQKGSNRSSPAMRAMLTKVLPTSKAARIVIDGIDESDHSTQQEVLKSLVEIQKSADHCCKLLVSSRDEPQIQKSLAAKTHLRLGEKTVKGLGLYIKDRINSLQATLEMDSELVSLAEQRLHSKANGMFLWVRLVTDMLSYQTSELEFRDAIDRLPEGLEEAYEVIQKRIDALRPIQLRQRAFRILYWVCAARRPILLHEVADGIVLHPGQTALNRMTRVKNPKRDIIDVCAPLLERPKNGVLEMVHFSATEYFLHEQSGPFIDAAKAHFNIAFSCIINLTSCLDLVPRATDGLSDEDLDSRVVQGCYGLHSYGQEFWSEHVLAYLGKVADGDADATELIRALEAFSQVWKHHTHTGTLLPPTLHTVEASLGLNSLRKFPQLYRFISGWLHFKFECIKTRPTLNTLDAQEQWRLGNDETFLSLIDKRLCKFTERLLMMQSSQLPSHIDENDFKDFVSRFKLPCRFQGCKHQCDTVQERDAHEATHVLSFPCLQCDFSGRGFRSRKDLERHTQKYHMSPEDFEIPDDLNALRGSPSRGPNATSGASRGLSSGSGCWSEQGRKALQLGFCHVLTRLESEIAAAASNDGEQGLKDFSLEDVAEPRLSQRTNEAETKMCLDSIRHSVQEHKYESLAEFKNDLSVLSGEPMTAARIVGDGRIESICDDEFEKAMSAFPAFANFDHTVVSSSSGFKQLRGGAEGFVEKENDMASPSPISFGARAPYWSLPEEKQFPELLQQYGRDFARIADHLKTKTPKQVDQHFLHLSSMGDIELPDVANLADASLEREACSIGSTTDPRGAELEIPPDDLGHGTSYNPLQSSQASIAGAYFPPSESPKTPLALRQGTTKRAELGGESDENMDGPIRKKRRPRPKALCPHCSVHKDGLRDEYTLERHIERYHTATRNVWICEDVSIDKRFLANCKSCSASKRYRSKNNASKHLRTMHFKNEPSAETLQRWIRKTEEPNPNILNSSAGSTSTTRPTMEIKTAGGRTISLPLVKNHLDSSRTLPSTILQTNSQKPSKSLPSSSSFPNLDDNVDEDEDIDARDASLPPPETQSFEHDTFLEDIFFDNVLPGVASEPRLPSNDGPPHRINRALIKPDQVSRLPNLDDFKKAVCLDQVEALYHELDNSPEMSLDYRESLESLTSLSRWLMGNLKDWRRHSTFAPHIPVSF